MIDSDAKIILLVLCFVIILLILKNINNTFAKISSFLVSILILIYCIYSLGPIIDFVNVLSNRAGIDDETLKIIFKCIGICILGEFTMKVCIDHGENALSSNTEFLCKISIIILSLPIYSDIFNLVLSLWEK